ncbi:MAG: serine protease [Verrucomicrobiota bacterium]
MKRRFSIFTLLALAAALATPLNAAPEAEAATGRDLMKRYADAVVGLELVLSLRVKMGDREAPPRESRIDVNGTVISPSGLTVTTLANVDPQATMSAMGGNSRGAEIVGSDFKEIKMRFADGREVPARFVLKDADLDLAFMAPETNEPGKVYPYVKLEEAAEAKVLQTLYYVARAPKALQRVPLVRATEVMGIVEKPRKFYLLTQLSPGTPVFDAQGKVLGVALQYFSNGGFTSNIVLPAVDIADMAKQAAAAQAKGP